jgi:hypothetical protein
MKKRKIEIRVGSYKGSFFLLPTLHFENDTYRLNRGFSVEFAWLMFGVGIGFINV